MYLSFQQQIKWHVCIMTLFSDLLDHTGYLEKVQLKKFNATWLNLVCKSCVAKMKMMFQVGNMRR